MSKIVAILPCRNSGWILGLSARALMMWCDSIVILDHASNDSTPQIITDLRAEYSGRVVNLRKGDAVWAEMSHRNTLLEIAREEFSPSHIVIIDDDELIAGNLLPRIRQMVEATPRGAVLQLPWVQLKGSINTYISSGMWSQQCASTAFPDDPAYCWAARNGYDHHNRHPMGKPHVQHMPLGRNAKTGGIMHLQMASDKRLRYKQAHYVMACETLRYPGRKTPRELNAMYGPTVYAPGSTLSLVPAEWWNGYEHLMKYLDVDAEPWQKSECQRLWKEHGPERFAGLDLFGVEL